MPPPWRVKCRGLDLPTVLSRTRHLQQQLRWWIHNSPCSFSLEAVYTVWFPCLLRWLLSLPMAMPTDDHWGTMLLRIYPRIWRNNCAKLTHERWEEEDLVLELISMFLKASFSSGDIKSNKEPPGENWEEPEVWLKAQVGPSRPSPWRLGVGQLLPKFWLSVGSHTSCACVCCVLRSILDGLLAKSWLSMVLTPLVHVCMCVFAEYYFSWSNI